MDTGSAPASARGSLDITAYPHIFDAILTASLSSAETIKALRALCHAARDAVEAKLARHVVVKSTTRERQRYLGLWSALDRAPIPGVRGRNYVALSEGRESTALPPLRTRLGGTANKRTLESSPTTRPPDVTPAQAQATIERLLKHTRVLDVGEYVAGVDLLALAPWLALDTVRLPSYRLAGANNDNPTLRARTLVLSPSSLAALRSSYALVVPSGTECIVSHEFIDISPGTCANIYCGHGPAPSTAAGDADCSCQTVREVVLAFVQRKPKRGTSELELGYTPERVLAVARTFPHAKIVLAGAEASRLGCDPPIRRPYAESNDVIRRLIVDESVHADLLDRNRIECVKLSEWRRRVGEKRWEIEMGLGDLQVLKMARLM